MNEVKLGLGEPPVRVYLTVGEADGAGWAKNEGGKWVGVPERALWGRVTDVRLVPKEFRGKPSLKLDVYVQADRAYVIRAGHDTTFSRGLLLALSSITDFSQVLALCVEPGSDNEKVVFGKVYKANGEPVQVEWDKNRSLVPIVQELQKRLKTVVQTPEDLKS